MGEYKTEAILLAVRDFGDTDRMVTLFSRDFGKLSAVAYGARRPRSLLSGSVQPFVQAELNLAGGKNLDSIRQCDIKRSFREVREDLTAMAYANFVAELAAELWPEREAEPRVYELLVAAFTLMTQRNPRITALAAAFQLLELAGFRPEYANCVVCAAPLKYPARFDPQAGGAVCETCGPHGGLEYTEEINAFVRRLSTLDWENPGQFSVTGSILLKTEKLLTEFIAYHLDRPLKSLAFIAAVI